MDKSEEREQVRKVFGTLAAASAAESESPDFLLKTASGVTLGIEVTEVFADDVDAKLAKHHSYASELLDGQRMHRSDRGKFEVGEVTIEDADGNAKARTTAIIQKMPSLRERVDLLLAKISRKEAKIVEYTKDCDRVDLIVADGSNLFMHKSQEELYGSFFPLLSKPALLKTPFREIYLLTVAGKGQQVYFPLLANTFVADCFGFEHLIEEGDPDGRTTFAEVFELVTACLFLEGYRGVVVAQDGTGFLCGAWEWHYGEDSRNIRDWMLAHAPYVGESIAEAIGRIAPERLERAQDLVALRASIRSSVAVRLPAHDSRQIARTGTDDEVPRSLGRTNPD
jgi:hypothetical protein